MSSTGDLASKCQHCRRILRSAASIARRAGRWCAAKARKAERLARIARDFKAAQVEKALEMIADGGLVATNREGVFRTVSSRGDDVYLTHSATCTCEAGRRGRFTCYHVLAVRLVLAGA